MRFHTLPPDGAMVRPVDPNPKPIRVNFADAFRGMPPTDLAVKRTRYQGIATSEKVEPQVRDYAKQAIDALNYELAIYGEGSVNV